MNIIKALFAGFLTVWVCIAQTNVTISGKVTDTGTMPIAGAIVKLENGGLTATTGSDGSFTIIGTTGIIKTQFNKPLSGKITASLHNGYLNLNIRAKSNIAITTYTIQGETISSIRKIMEAGTHSVAISTKSAGVYFYRIQSGKDEIVIKNNSLASVSGGIELSSQNQSLKALTMQAKSYVPINDVIKVEKEGYLNYRMQVTSSDTSGIVIKMILQDAGTITDVDGNVYHAIRIGNQVWTVENLRTTKYNDGSDIPIETDNTAWSNLTTPGYCWYNNDATNKAKYGALYNWYTVNPANPKKIATAGWHVPTDAEWTILEKYLVLNGYNWDGTTDTSAYNKIAKSLASKTDWVSSTWPGAIGNDLTTNNSSGFSGLPGGYRDSYGTFSYQSHLGYWWSASESDASSAWHRDLYYVYDNFGRNYLYSKSCGFSVRLLRDLN